jgi:N-acetyl-gamma-glutamyl-phosphate reductase
MKFRVGVVGGSGYAGLELLKILFRHPSAECATVMAIEVTKETDLGDIHPELRGASSVKCVPPSIDRLAELELDTVFLCTPNEASHDIAPKLLAHGIKVIDFSGSFRLRDISSYSSWYGFRHEAPEALNMAVYGLAEWNAKAVSQARLIANPGCYPTSILLPMLPIVRAGMLEEGSDLICDAKSGVTGAGRSAKVDTLFAEVSENFRPYGPLTHRHGPEICQELDWDFSNFMFVPHLLPCNRGMLSTIYVSFHQPTSSAEIEAVMMKKYEKHPFVRILGNSRLPEIRAVSRTNFCDIGWRMGNHGRRGVFFSAIDNLIKGAAGQAVQNFNIMHGLEQTQGILEGGGVEIHS